MTSLRRIRCVVTLTYIRLSPPSSLMTSWRRMMLGWFNIFIISISWTTSSYASFTVIPSSFSILMVKLCMKVAYDGIPFVYVTFAFQLLKKWDSINLHILMAYFSMVSFLRTSLTLPKDYLKVIPKEPSPKFCRIEYWLNDAFPWLSNPCIRCLVFLTRS